MLCMINLTRYHFVLVFLELLLAGFEADFSSWVLALLPYTAALSALAALAALFFAYWAAASAFASE